jgi:hypothetical protein
VAAGERASLIAESSEQGDGISDAGRTMIGERTRNHGTLLLIGFPSS